jgi:hypothetical protein
VNNQRLLIPPLFHKPLAKIIVSRFSITRAVDAKRPEYPPLNEEEIVEVFAKGSGPGGQKLNKATNRCQLKHIPTGNLFNHIMRFFKTKYRGFQNIFHIAKI